MVAGSESATTTGEDDDDLLTVAILLLTAWIAYMTLQIQRQARKNMRVHEWQVVYCPNERMLVVAYKVEYLPAAKGCHVVEAECRLWLKGTRIRWLERIILGREIPLTDTEVTRRHVDAEDFIIANAKHSYAWQSQPLTLNDDPSGWLTMRHKLSDDSEQREWFHFDRLSQFLELRK